MLSFVDMLLLDLTAYLERYNVTKTIISVRRKQTVIQNAQRSNFENFQHLQHIFRQYGYNMHTYGYNMNAACIKTLRPGVALPPAARQFEKRHIRSTHFVRV